MRPNMRMFPSEAVPTKRLEKTRGITIIVISRIKAVPVGSRIARTPRSQVTLVILAIKPIATHEASPMSIFV